MRANVLLLSILLLATTLPAPTARADGMAFCDVVMTKCAGAATYGVSGCASAAGLFDYEVCASVGGAAAAAMSLCIGCHVGVLTSASAPGVPGKMCQKQFGPVVAPYWATVACASTISSGNACVTTQAYALAQNALGALPMASGNENCPDGAIHVCGAGVSSKVPPLGDLVDEARPERPPVSVKDVPDPCAASHAGAEARIRDALAEAAVAQVLARFPAPRSAEEMTLLDLLTRSVEDDVRQVDLVYYAQPARGL